MIINLPYITTAINTDAPPSNFDALVTQSIAEYYKAEGNKNEYTAKLQYIDNLRTTYCDDAAKFEDAQTSVNKVLRRCINERITQYPNDPLAHIQGFELLSFAQLCYTDAMQIKLNRPYADDYGRSSLSAARVVYDIIRLVIAYEVPADTSTTPPDVQPPRSA